MKCIIRFSFLVLAISTMLFACKSTAPKQEDPVEENVWTMLASGDERAREYFLSEYDAHATDINGQTPLHYAAMRDDAVLANFFIAMGADPNAEDFSSLTPLGICAEKNSINAAGIIAKAGADIHKPSIGGITPANAALGINRAGFLQAILTPATLESTDASGKTILHIATEKGNLPAVRIILSVMDSYDDAKRDIIINKKDRDGQTPVDIALSRLDSQDHIKIAEQLILSGAVSNSRIYNYFAPAVKNNNYNQRWADGLTLFHYAAGGGHEGFIYFLVGKNANVNIKNSSGATPLHEAVKSGKLGVIKLILQNGADINAQDAKGNTPLHIAAPIREHAAVLQLLLEYGANPNLRDAYGDSPLHVLITLNRSPEIVKVLLANNKIDVAMRNIKGQTPLFIAVHENRVALIPLLLAARSDIFAADNSGVTPFDRAMQVKGPVLDAMITSETARQTDSAGNTILHIAVRSSGDTIIIGKILDQNANVNARNREGDTALHIAARTNQKDPGEYILSRGADIFSSNSVGESPLYIALTHPSGILVWMFNHETAAARDGLGNTMLHYAALWKIDRHIPFIIQNGVSTEAANVNGETPLFWAVKYDGASTVRTLLAARANIDARDTLENSSLHAAVQWNSRNAASALLDGGIDVNAHSLDGTTPLHNAVSLNYTDMAQILINNGAELEIRENSGNTPFMEAVRGGSIDAMDILARNGADPITRNAAGDTPLHIAVMAENTRLIQSLLGMGASIHARNSRNRTPFQIALTGSPEILSALLTRDRVNSPNDFGNSPLHIAIDERVPVSTLRIILEKGTRLNTVDFDGRTPLRLAIDKNAWELAKILADAGADVFLTAVDGKSPADVVLAKGNEAIRAVFSGRAINAKDTSGNTILHYAAKLNRPNAITTLLELGASKSARNIAAESPADVAVRWNNRENAVLLN
jgi:ankyrin repeat protein